MSTKERFRYIKGYEGIYYMDELDGEIISIKRIKRKSLKPTINNGYPRIILSRGDKRRAYQVSQLYIDTFYPYLKDKEIINMVKKAINTIVVNKLQNKSKQF